MCQNMQKGPIHMAKEAIPEVRILKQRVDVAIPLCRPPTVARARQGREGVNIERLRASTNVQVLAAQRGHSVSDDAEGLDISPEALDTSQAA